MGGKKDKLARKLAHVVSESMLKPWTPFERATMPGFPDAEVWLNSRYQVLVNHFEIPAPFGHCIHLSIKTRDKSAWHDWRDYQRIKNELVGIEVEAVEVYPAESRLMDTANQFHLWCFPNIAFPDNRFPFGYAKREVTEAGVQDPFGTRSEQRPFELKPPDLKSHDKAQADAFDNWNDLYLGHMHHGLTPKVKPR